MFRIRSLVVFLCLSLSVVGTLNGQNYFQQETNFTINVELYDSLHPLVGREEKIYTNHSLDTLNEIYFLLYPNAYSRNNTEMASRMKSRNNLTISFLDELDKRGKTGLLFKVNNTIVEMNSDHWNPDICKIKLLQLFCRANP